MADATQPMKIGFLYSGTQKSLFKQFAAFHTALGKAGYGDDDNIKIEYRFADNDYAALPNLAADLVQKGVSVIVAAGGAVSALAARTATDKEGKSIPIVFTTIAHPREYGLVDDLAHPNKNATGTAGLTSELDEDRLALLKELVPSASVIGVLVNKNRPREAEQTKYLLERAKAMNIELRIVGVASSKVADFTAAKKELSGDTGGKRVDALLPVADPLFNTERENVLRLAEELGVPAAYQWREFVEEGGLISLGTSITEAYKKAAEYAVRILQGASPKDLPVVQPDRKALKPVINVSTAERLGLEIPASLRARSELIN